MKDFLEDVYTMNVETSEGVKQHPYHLGTDHAIAETFVKEELEKDDVKSVALKQKGKTVKIYDWRDLEGVT